MWRKQSQDPHQSSKQKQQEFADTTISKEAVIRCQIPNSYFAGKSSHELKNHKADHMLFLENRFITYT